jgi:hypothetical protein
MTLQIILYGLLGVALLAVILAVVCIKTASRIDDYGKVVKKK